MSSVGALSRRVQVVAKLAHCAAVTQWIEYLPPKKGVARSIRAGGASSLDLGVAYSLLIGVSTIK